MAKPKARTRTTPTDAQRDVKAAFARVSKTGNLQAANEAKTRLLLVDAVLEAMGWTKDEFCPETSTHVGDFTDYLLSSNGEPWLVVEAKRYGAAFDIPAPTGPQSNSTVRSLAKVFDRSGKSFQEATKQATRYCNDRAVSFGCVTNGAQWVFFRGLSRERDPWRTGNALVFGSHQDVIARFDEFWVALAHDAAGTSQLARALDRHASTVPRSGERPIDSIRAYRPRLDPETDSYVRAASLALLGDLYGNGDDDFLERCYIEPTTEGDFERSLRRLLEDSIASIDGDCVQEGDTKAFLDELQRTHEHAVPGASTRQPIVVVGHVGAGKSTFIRRALSQIRESADAYFAVVNLDADGAAGTFDARVEENRIAGMILTTLGHAATTTLKKHNRRPEVVALGAPNAPATVERLFANELRGERELGAAFAAADPPGWKKHEFEFLKGLRSDSVKHLLRFTNHLRHHVPVSHGRCLPVMIVIDNVDVATDDYQRLVFGFARQISRDALVVMCMREDTYSKGRETGGFLTSSALQFVFHVRSPAFDKLLRARISFARRCLDDVEKVPSRLRPAFQAKDKLDDFLASIEHVLLAQNSEALQVIAALAGHDMRDGLGLVRSVAIGDAVCTRRRLSSAAYGLECLFAARNFTDDTSRVHLANLVDSEASEPPAHGLRVRLLAYLAWARETGAARVLNERSETIIARFAMLGYAPGNVERSIRDLLTQRAVQAADRGEASPSSATVIPNRLALTASGLIHLRWLWTVDTYRAAMALTTRWYSKTDLQEFVAQATEASGSGGLTIGDIAASPALATFNAYLRRSWAEEDASLAAPIRRNHDWAREIDSRTPDMLAGTPPLPRPESGSASKPRPPRPTGKQQLGLVGMSGPERHPTELRPLPADFEHEGSVWLPRILWAMEYAHRMGLPPRTSAEMARILNDHGEQAVVRNNVARAFREYKRRDLHQHYWRIDGKRYSLTQAGHAALEAALAKVIYAGG